MTLQEAWQWLEQFTNLEKTPSATMRTWRLDRMHALLELRDHPEAVAKGLSLLDPGASVRKFLTGRKKD